jgi:hypothetical protein
MLTQILNDETATVVSAELILILTISFCGAAVGWSTIGSAIVSELDDISEMVGVIDQTYNVTAHAAPINETTNHGSCSPFGFNDQEDDCDCQGVVLIETAGKIQTGAGDSENGTAVGA